MTRMDCQEVRDLLHASVDGELPEDERAAVHRHTADCPDCKRALADLEALRARIRMAGTFSLPETMRARADAVLGARIGPQTGARRGRLAAALLTHAAAVIVGALLTYGLLGRLDLTEQIARDVVAAHVRAHLSGQPVQVASADTHTVKPWFVGRIAFAPEVRDLARDGFELIGGRLDYVLERPAAALVYGRRQHRISVFVMPADQAAGPAQWQASRNGYNVMSWSNGRFVFSAVSDLNVEELGQFCRHLGSG